MFRLALLALLAASLVRAAEPAPPPRAVRFDSVGDKLPPGVNLRLGTERFHHPGGIVGVKFSPDGTRLLTLGFHEDDAIVWDVATGRRLAELEPRLRGKEYICSFDGIEYRVKDWVMSIPVPGTNREYACGYDHAYRYDGEPAKVTWSARVTAPNVSGPGLKLSAAIAMDLSADGKLLAVATSAGHITVLDSDNGEPAGFSKRHPGYFLDPLNGPTLLPDGRIIVDRNKTTVLWDLRGSKPLRTIVEDTSEGTVEAVSPDDRTLVRSLFATLKTGAWKRIAVIEEVETGRGLLVTHLGPWPRFSEDGARLHLRWDWEEKPRLSRLIRISNAAGSLRAELERDDLPEKLDPTGHNHPRSPDFKQVPVSNARDLWLLDLAGGQKLWTWTIPKECGLVHHVHFTGEGKRIIVEMESRRSEYTEGLFVLDRATGRQLHRLPGREIEAISPDGRFAAVADWQDRTSEILVYDVESGRVLKRWEEGRTPVFSPDSRRLALITDSCTFEVHDLAKNRPLGPPRTHMPEVRSSEIRSLRFTPDGRSVMASYNDATIRFWDVTSPDR